MAAPDYQVEAHFKSLAEGLLVDPQRYLLPVEAYFFSEDLMQKKIELGGIF